MKTVLRTLSYIIAVLLGFCAALLLTLYSQVNPGAGKLQAVQDLINSCFVGEFSQSEVEDAAAKAMISALGDRWSYYLTASEYAAYQEQSDNAYVGIGITVRKEEASNAFRILAIDPDGSAKQAGLSKDDLILAVNDESTEAMTIYELREHISGEIGTAVTLDVLREDTQLTFSVMRSKILTEVAAGIMLENHIGLITIHNFDSRCAEESIRCIDRLISEGADSLIFDVRNNHGGYASEMVTLLDHILPEGEIFRSVDYAGRLSIDQSDADCLSLPMAVICNESSYSAAEFFAAALQEYGVAVIIGSQTCGKGYFQYVFEMDDGSAVGLSCGKYYTPLGNSLINTGITPDIPVDVDSATNEAISSGMLSPYEDPQVLAAMSALLHG